MAKFRPLDISSDNWSSLSGSWTRSSVVIRHIADDAYKGDFNFYLSDRLISDGAVEAIIKVSNTGDASGRLVVRYGPDGCYYAGVGGYGSHFSIVKYVRSAHGGCLSMGLALHGRRSEIKFDEPYHLRVEFVGDTITLKNSGITVLQAKDSWFSTGHVGVETFGATNVEFMSLTAFEVAPVNELVRVLESFPDALKRDYRYNKREIIDEPDVQRILWTMLRSHYADLVDEDTLRKFGIKSYKSDFGIPSLATIVEAKVVYENTNLRKLQEELMTDSVAYFATMNSYRYLVFFIYNKANLPIETALVRDLEKLDCVVAVVVVPGVRYRPETSRTIRELPTRRTKRPDTRG